MPYIEPHMREALDAHARPGGAGDLNYCITKLCHNYVGLEDTNYRVLNEVIGVLECAKQEFYRRVVAPYEDVKILENGDIER